MKKSTLVMALGGEPEGDEDEEMDQELSGDNDSDSDTDDAIATLLDDKADMATRIEAFKQAVTGCKSK